MLVPTAGVGERQRRCRRFAPRAGAGGVRPAARRPPRAGSRSVRGRRRGRALAAARRRRCWQHAGRRSTASVAARHALTASAVAARAAAPSCPAKASSTSRCQLRRSMRWLVPCAVTSTQRSPSSRRTACDTSAPSTRQVARPDTGTSRESVIRSSSGIPSSARRARRRGARIVEDCGDARGRGARPDRLRLEPAAERCPERVDAHRFPGTGLAGEHAEAIVERKPRFLDDREVADAELTKGHSYLPRLRGCRHRPARGAGPCAGSRIETSGEGAN